MTRVWDVWNDPRHPAAPHLTGTVSPSGARDWRTWVNHAPQEAQHYRGPAAGLGGAAPAGHSQQGPRRSVARVRQRRHRHAPGGRTTLRVHTLRSFCSPVNSETSNSIKMMSLGSQRILKRMEKRGQPPASVTEPRQPAAPKAEPRTPPVHQRLHRNQPRASPKQRAAAAVGKQPPAPSGPPRSRTGADGRARRKAVEPPAPPPAKVVAAIHKYGPRRG